MAGRLQPQPQCPPGAATDAGSGESAQQRAAPDRRRRRRLSSNRFGRRRRRIDLIDLDNTNNIGGDGDGGGDGELAGRGGGGGCVRRAMTTKTVRGNHRLVRSWAAALRELAVAACLTCWIAMIAVAAPVVTTAPSLSSFALVVAVQVVPAAHGLVVFFRAQKTPPPPPCQRWARRGGGKSVDDRRMAALRGLAAAKQIVSDDSSTTRHSRSSSSSPSSSNSSSTITNRAPGTKVQAVPSNLTTGSQAVAAIRTFREMGDYDSIVRFMNVAAAPFAKDPVVGAAALSALCRHSPLEALELFHDMVEASHIEPTSSAMESVMTSIAVLYEGDVDTILFWQDRLSEMHPHAWTDSRPWDATLAAALLADDGGDGSPSGSLEAGMALYKSMKQLGVEPGTRTYQLLFQACADREDGPAAEALLDDLLAAGQGQQRRSKVLTPRLWSSVLRAFAAAGDAAGCRRVLRTIVELGSNPTVHHYTFYIHSLLPNTKQMLEVLRHMHGDDASIAAANGLSGLPPVAPDAVAIKAVLRLCGMVGDFDTARQVLTLVRQGALGGSDVTADEAMYNLVLASCGDAAEAKAVIREMRLTRRHRYGCIPPSLVSYTHAITACRRAADLASAQLFLRWARVDGLAPDVVMYTAAVWASARAGNVTAATAMLAEMQVHNCTPNEISYNGALESCATCENAAEAMRIYLEMVGRGLLPSGQTFRLLSRSIRAEENATTKVMWLQRVYATMDAHQRAAGTGGPIAEALIQGLASVNRFDDALEIFTAIRGRADDWCLRSILSACSTVTPPRWEEALSILHAIDAGSPSGAQAPVDPIALGYAMLACSKADQFEESLSLFHLHGGRDTPLPAINSLIGACGRCGRPDVAMMVLNDVDDRGVSLDARSYRNAIVACNQGQHRTRRVVDPETSIEGGGFEWWECALSLIRRMKERGLRPDVQSYSACISACEAAGQWQAALSLLQSLLDEEEDNQGSEQSMLNLHCFNAAISACAKGGAWVEALELYERMKTRRDVRIRPTVVTLGSLIDGLDRAGQKDLAKRIHVEGVRKKVLIPWRKTRASDGRTVLAMDLHSFTAAMARAAVSTHADSLLMNLDPIDEDWIIVVGKGLRSEEEPVLQATVVNLLRSEYGIESFLDQENSGRVVVAATELTKFLEKHQA
jgi:pentatricopeptide repeat protein